MDLIYTDESHVDQGYLPTYNFDCENSPDLRDFVLTVPRSAVSILKPGCYVYADEDTEFGGMITRMTAEPDGALQFYGKTWRAMLEMQVVRPPSGQAYRTYSRQSISAIMRSILVLYHLDHIFEVQDTNESINYTFDRYCTVLSGFEKLMRNNGYRLRCYYNSERHKVVLSARAPQDLSASDYSSYKVKFKLEKDFYPVNHLICLGRGELTDRDVCDLYLQADGTVGTRQVFTGADEVVGVYEYSNAEDSSQLQAEGIKKLLELQQHTAITVSLKDLTVSLGDTVSGTEEITGTTVTKAIVGKILNMTPRGYQISYKTGDVQ